MEATKKNKFEAGGAFREKMWQVRKRYGLSVPAFFALWDAQGHGCAVCKAYLMTPEIAVDHSHLTGEVRGLLCDTCNRGLGYFKDDPELLRSAASYLEDPPQGAKR